MRSQVWRWIIAGLTLVASGLLMLVGATLLLADTLAIDPEDQVPVDMYAVPLALGALPWVVLAVWLGRLYVRWVRRSVKALREDPDPAW